MARVANLPHQRGAQHGLEQFGIHAEHEDGSDKNYGGDLGQQREGDLFLQGLARGVEAQDRAEVPATTRASLRVPVCAA